MSQLSTFFPTVTATSLGLGNSANVTFGSVTTGAVTASGTLSGAGFTNRFASPGPIGSTTPSTGAFTTLSANNGTITASAPALDLSQTWNNAAVAFTGLRFDVTNTTSSTSSRLVHLTVGGSNNAVGIYRDATGSFSATPRFEIGSAGVAWNIRTRTSAGVGCNFDSTVGIGGSLQFGVGTTTAAGDVFLAREAADTLALQRGTAAQTFRLYNTTDAGLTNFERGFMRWSSNVLQIGTEAGGTGSARNLELQTGGTTRFTIASTGASILGPSNLGVVFGATGGGNITLYGSGLGVQPVLFRSNAGAYRFALDASTSTSNGFVLAADANDIAALRDGTDAQIFRIYNTVSGTNNVNFERANLRWASNEFIIDAEAGGTGTSLRGIKIGSATSSLLGFYGATPVDRPATVADPTGGGTIDAEARTAINDIIDRLQELGLIA